MIDKSKLLIAGISLLIGFVLGFIVQHFVSKIILLIAGFGLGIAFMFWWKERKEKKQDK